MERKRKIHLDRCLGCCVCTPGKRVWRNAPGVRIPAHPRLISWACSCSRLLRANRPLFDDLQFLPQFDHAPVWENTAKVYAGINHAIAADHRARIDHCVATDLRTIANNRAEFSEA